MLGDVRHVPHWYDWIFCATGNKGLAGLISNPVLANGVAGLATSATAQATIERFVLWTLRDSVSFHHARLHQPALSPCRFVIASVHHDAQPTFT